MIEHTFLHLPSLGRVIERRLWQAGFDCWDRLWEALRSGTSIAELFRCGVRQRELFTAREEPPSEKRALAWLDCLDQSRHALRAGDYRFFVDRLRPADQWRVLAPLVVDALYLDIETTGLSRELHYVTVIGALWRRRFFQWVWPEPLDKLAGLIAKVPLVVTFNGARFDLPFLRLHAPDVPAPRAHVDLLHLARAAGLKGGQKAAEEKLGLRRDAQLDGFDGLQAVVGWCRALYGDHASYKKLLSYNRADVELMPQLAAKLCDTLRGLTVGFPQSSIIPACQVVQTGRRPAVFSGLQRAWEEHRAGIHRLAPKLLRRFGRMPLVVGIDLRAKSIRPTGWALCQGTRAETRILYTDEEILDLTRRAKPDLVSIDAPLFLPRGRQSVSDDSPCRESGGIVRDAERILWSRRIPVYPALIRQMQGLTQRGIEMSRQLEADGIPVIESYPGAAQDILGIPRKRVDESLLDLGLAQFGFKFSGTKTHDELDAITSALVGYFYLADEYEGIGADDEGFMVLPQWTAMMRWTTARPNGAIERTVSLVGLPGAGKTTLCRALSRRLGWRPFVLGDALRARAQSDPLLSAALGRGELAPEALVELLIREAAAELQGPGLILDGFPRHREQLELVRGLFPSCTVLYLHLDRRTAASRLQNRLTCRVCGHVVARQTCSSEQCPGCGGRDWYVRPDDADHASSARLTSAEQQLAELLATSGDVRVVEIDASRPAGEVEIAAVAQLRATRLARPAVVRAY